MKTFIGVLRYWILEDGFSYRQTDPSGPDKDSCNQMRVLIIRTQRGEKIKK